MSSSGYCDSCRYKFENTPIYQLLKGKRVNVNGHIEYAYCFECKQCCVKINCWCQQLNIWWFDRNETKEE